MKRRPTSAPPSRRGRTARASACDAKIPQTVLASRGSASAGAGRGGAGLADQRMQMIRGQEVVPRYALGGGLNAARASPCGHICSRPRRSSAVTLGVPGIKLIREPAAGLEPGIVSHDCWPRGTRLLSFHFASACDAKIPQTALASRGSASFGAGREGAGLAD